MKGFKKVVLGIVSVSLIALGVGCGGGNSDMEKIKLAEVTHSVFYAPQYVALEEGFFEEEGLEIELIVTQGADKTMAALLSGEAQVGLMGPEASVYVYNQGSKEYAISFAQLTKRDGSFLVSRKEEPNFTFEDLKGKEVIGGRKGGVPEMTLEYVIKNNGLEVGLTEGEGDVYVRTDIQFGVMAGAFTGGEGDYVTLFEPLATAMEKEGGGYVVASIGEASGEIPYTAYCALNTYMEENDKVIQKFTNAVYKGQKFVQENEPRVIAQIIAPHFKELSIEDLTTVVERYQRIDAWSKDPTLKKESLEKLMDVMTLAGELEVRAPYEKIVTTKYAKEAMK